MTPGNVLIITSLAVTPQHLRNASVDLEALVECLHVGLSNTRLQIAAAACIDLVSRYKFILLVPPCMSWLVVLCALTGVWTDCLNWVQEFGGEKSRDRPWANGSNVKMFFPLHGLLTKQRQSSWLPVSGPCLSLAQLVQLPPLWHHSGWTLRLRYRSPLQQTPLLLLAQMLQEMDRFLSTTWGNPRPSGECKFTTQEECLPPKVI